MLTGYEVRNPRYGEEPVTGVLPSGQAIVDFSQLQVDLLLR